MNTSDKAALGVLIFVILIAFGCLFFKDSSPISVTQYDSKGKLIFFFTIREKAFSCTASFLKDGQTYTAKYRTCDGALELLHNLKGKSHENNA